ncbi:replication-relaxation family protein [Planosporangium mesophilum]|uniref:replication-relaxation family protein n=1 Tax=Planosporangium mesophilum TaxID=689768 RepID=UPI0035710BD3
MLLDQHRVMTTGQLARATDAPDRTVRYRLERLREARLADCVRPVARAGRLPGTGGCVRSARGWSTARRRLRARRPGCSWRTLPPSPGYGSRWSSTAGPWA